MTKTCGECKHLNKELAFCRACGAKWIKETDGANCKYFEQIQPPTNGDVIRQGGNRALAEFHGKLACDVCAYRYDHRCIAPQGKPLTCVDGIEAWLNAPAESEGKDE
ncbi:MAG: hypothetical protein J6T08_01545 [Lentisphaeria bacterium]|nr:hypothetical protein [Lentisphaeria bacterium]